MLDLLRELPPLASCQPVPNKKKEAAAKAKKAKKKSKNLIKVEQKANPEYGQSINPISRLIQIQQAKKQKEPVYTLIAEKGMPRRREFVMQVGRPEIYYYYFDFLIGPEDFALEVGLAAVGVLRAEDPPGLADFELIWTLLPPVLALRFVPVFGRPFRIDFLSGSSFLVCCCSFLLAMSSSSWTITVVVFMSFRRFSRKNLKMKINFDKYFEFHKFFCLR